MQPGRANAQLEAKGLTVLSEQTICYDDIVVATQPIGCGKFEAHDSNSHCALHAIWLPDCVLRELSGGSWFGEGREEQKTADDR